VTNATHGLGPKVLRIGLTQDWLNTADPAVTRSPSGTGRWQWQLHNATCAELYRHPDAAGAAGDALQPELAAGLPQRSAGGRRWTIALRSGLRFSPPLNRPVTGEDIRASIVRALSPQLGPSAHAAGVLRSVDGLRAYRRGAKDVPGISLRRGALVVRTIRPVDDLAARLALPYFCVLPAGIPTPAGGYPDPIPTAGPYYLAAHQGGEVAVLRPNPGYHGPRGQHLDGLILDLNVDDRTGVSDVRRGRLDYFTGDDEATSSRLGCRLTRAHLPGPDLAALCVVPPPH
jgi:ABC-type transport system substrate-binding protein